MDQCDSPRAFQLEGLCSILEKFTISSSLRGHTSKAPLICFSRQNAAMSASFRIFVRDAQKDCCIVRLIGFVPDIFRISSTIFQESLSYLSIQHSFEIWSQPVRCTSQHSFTWVSHCLQDISASSAILCPHLLLMLAVLHTTKNSSSAYFPKKFYLALSCSPHTSKSSTRRKPLHDNTPFLLSPCSC